MLLAKYFGPKFGSKVRRFPSETKSMDPPYVPPPLPPKVTNKSLLMTSIFTKIFPVGLMI